MYLVFKPTNTPTRKWARNLPDYMVENFNEAFLDTNFVDRDHLDDAIIAIPFIPNDYRNIKQKYQPIIKYINDCFETIAIWENILPVGYVEPITTFIVVGYEKDVLATLSTLSYIINGFNNLDVKITKEYRRIRIKNRRKQQYRGKKLAKYPHARLKANNLLTGYINKLSSALSNIQPEYSVLHAPKLTNVEEYIIRTKKLDYKKYHTDHPKIHHAYCKPTQIILNRIIV